MNLKDWTDKPKPAEERKMEKKQLVRVTEWRRLDLDGKTLCEFGPSGEAWFHWNHYSQVETAALLLALIGDAIKTGLIDEQCTITEAFSDLEGVIRDHSCPF